MFGPPGAARIELLPLEGREFAVGAAGPPRRFDRIEATEDRRAPVPWQAIAAGMADDGMLIVLETATNRARYYRAVRD